MRELKEEEFAEAVKYIICELRDCNAGIYRKFISGELTLLQAMRAAEFMFDKWDEEGEQKIMEMAKAVFEKKKLAGAKS